MNELENVWASRQSIQPAFSLGDLTNRFMQLLLPALLASVAVLLNGCMAGVILPVPHTTRATPEIHGRFSDATTGEAVGDVILRIPERPKTFAISSKGGFVTLKRNHKFHWLLAGGRDDWEHFPNGYEWSWTLEASHPDYEPRVFKAPFVSQDPLMIASGGGAAKTAAGSSVQPEG